MFIRDHMDRELYSLERLELKFDLSSEFFDKITVKILLDVLFRVFRFSKASFYALHLNSCIDRLNKSKRFSHKTKQIPCCHYPQLRLDYSLVCPRPFSSVSTEWYFPCRYFKLFKLVNRITIRVTCQKGPRSTEGRLL